MRITAAENDAFMDRVRRMCFFVGAWLTFASFFISQSPNKHATDVKRVKSTSL